VLLKQYLYWGGCSAAITGCVACVKHTGPGPRPIIGGPMIKIFKREGAH